MVIRSVTEQQDGPSTVCEHANMMMVHEGELEPSLVRMIILLKDAVLRFDFKRKALRSQCLSRMADVRIEKGVFSASGAFG
jgi:hypothetical protein